MTRAITVQVYIGLGKRAWPLMMESPFFWGWGELVIRAVWYRGDLPGSLSPLHVDPLGHAQWHPVLVIICIAATVLVSAGSALRARWPSTMALSMVVPRVRHVARN